MMGDDGEDDYYDDESGGHGLSSRRNSCDGGWGVMVRHKYFLFNQIQFSSLLLSFINSLIEWLERTFFF